MAEKILQCCYSNIRGQKAGWQTIAVSENIPADAYEKCVLIEQANSKLRGEMQDEDGNVLNLFEIHGDGKYLYLIRTQFGLKEMSAGDGKMLKDGRDNMFAHAYIFSWDEDDIISDPNVFLTIDNSNFQSNEKDASKPKKSFSRMPKWDVKQAMGRANLSPDHFGTLIRCIYTQMTTRNIGSPLYIQYDGTEEQMRALLYCIYRGLPHYLRRKVCIASNDSVSNDNKNIIFSQHAGTNKYYVDPSTGSNNVLTKRDDNKIDQLGYIDFVAKNIIKIQDDKYFALLERRAIQLGSVDASNEQILKIAHESLVSGDIEDYSDDDLINRLSSALRTNSFGNRQMEQYLSGMISEMHRRNMLLTEASEQNLVHYMNAATTEEFRQEAEAYHIFYIEQFETADAAKQLTGLQSDTFNRYKERLSHSQNGLAILDYYYANIRLPSQAITWEHLNQVLEESNDLPRRAMTEQKVEDAAWEHYCTLLKSPETAVENFFGYREIAGKTCSKEDIPRMEQSAREEYWRHITFDNASVDRIDDYQTMYVKTDFCEALLEFTDYLVKVVDINDVFYETIYTLFHKHDLSREEMKSAISYITRELKKLHKGQTEPCLAEWIALIASARYENTVNTLLTIKENLYRKKYDNIAVDYQSFASINGKSARTRKKGSELDKIVSYSCEKNDTESHPIPLDIWLVLGDNTYQNPFDILDDRQPFILEEDPKEVVTNSKLFEKYLRQADEYIKAKGDEAKTVKEWSKECRKRGNSSGKKKRKNPEKRRKQEKHRKQKGNFEYYIPDTSSGGDRVGNFFSNVVNALLRRRR